VKPRTHKKDSRVIVYDADCIEQVGPQLFDADAWQRKGSVVGVAEGRGSTLLLETDFGHAVLRQCLRGGWPARISRENYFFTGFDRSRPLAEFNMLARLRTLGLPVPHPLAAQCVRAGIFYSGSLLTRRIMDVVPLADLLGSTDAGPELWRATGACIRRFHDQGVVHADLNARNILIQDNETVYLIDFDRARVKKGAQVSFKGNLSRLRRSLDKLWPVDATDRLDASWASLLEAYAAVPAS
jgi:3-deoxy-D-manno-octulosonic acid kinase